jgi:hypothetical protein
MNSIRVAHLRAQGISYAVFDADSRTGLDSDRNVLLQDLTAAAERQGLRVQKAALAFTQGGRMTFYGTPDLVRYLAANGVGQWTHTLTI